MYSPFFPKPENLPQTLPIFPLENAVVMPRAELPLNIFEPRYLNMVNDALATHRMFGMVQPDPKAQGEPVPVYRTGCAGRITSYSETSDGRILLTLTGVCRFDIAQELPGIRGYRQVVPDWRRFLPDMETPADDDAERSSIISLLRGYLDSKSLTADWKLLQQLSTRQLVHSMTVLLPLEPEEKQTILESVDMTGRVESLRSALQFGLNRPADRNRH